MDGMLSQDEINALLSGMNTGGDDTSDSSTATTTIPEDNANDNTDGGFTLTESEKDAVGEISNISMGTAATTLSSLLSQKVNITTPKVEVATWDDLSSKYDRPCVMLQISYKEGLARLSEIEVGDGEASELETIKFQINWSRTPEKHDITASPVAAAAVSGAGSETSGRAARSGESSETTSPGVGG